MDLKKLMFLKAATGGGTVELYDAELYPLSNGWIHGLTGKYGSGSWSCVKDFIPCTVAAGKNITLNKAPYGNNPGFAFYSDKSEDSFISGEKSGYMHAEGTPWTVTVPATANYVRFTVPQDATDIHLIITK